MNWNTGGTTFDKPVDYIGKKTISNYLPYANKHVWDIAIPGCTGNGRVFVGQRKDPFVVNLGVVSEQLRLNTAIPPTAKGKQNRLGVLGGDNAGFPNGRRPGDDVVDIALHVAMGVLCTLNLGDCKPADAAAGALKYTDGAYIYDGYFSEDFPFLRAPLPGSPNADNAIKAKRN